MEDNTDSKRKITPSIPDNYISILQLKERWIKEKERKRKEEEEEEERRRKQQAEEQQRIEEDLKIAEVKRNRKKHWGRDRKKDESFDKEETSAIRSERGEEDAALRDDGLLEKKRGRRKRYDSKKKKNQEVAAVKEDVVQEYTVTENNTPVVKDHWKISDKAMGKRSVEYREEAVIDDDATAIGKQFEDLSINRGEERGQTKKTQTRSSNRARPKQRRDLSLRRVTMPTETPPMVWMKKGQNERADHGSVSGVKSLSS